MAWLWDLYPTQSPVTSIGKARESEAWQYGSRGKPEVLQLTGSS